MNAQYTRWLKIFLLAGWTIVVLWNFFYSFPLIHLFEILLNGAMLLILLVGLTALGRRVFRSLGISCGSFAEECCFSFGLGSGILIFLIFGLAVSGLLYEILIVLFVLAIFLLVYQDAKYICMKGYSTGSAIFSRKKTSIDVGLMLLMGFAGIVTFIAAATPPYFYDALVYHLAVPQKYLLQRGFYYIPSHHFSNFPMNLGMLFMVGMSFSGGMLAKLISWSFAPMTAFAVYGFVRLRWGAQMALTAAAISFLVPGILILSILTSVDLGVMFYSFLSFSALLSWFSDRQKYWFVLSGIFCSLAIGTKYTAIALTFFPLELILFFHHCFVEKRSWLSGLRKTIFLGLIVLCGVAPWFIKNSFYTGNPTYPLFNSFWGVHRSQYTSYDNYLATENPISKLLNSPGATAEYLTELIISYLTAPWTVTMKTSRAAGKTGVLFLLCLPGLFFLKKMDGTLRYLLAIAICLFWLWVVLFPTAALRYVFQMFPPLSIVTAYTFWNLPLSSQKRTFLLIGGSLLLLYHLMIFFGTTNVIRPFTYLFGNESQEQFLVGHGVGHYPVIQYINRETPEDSKILFVPEIRGYYCEREYIISTDAPYDSNEIILRRMIIESQSVAEVVEKLHHLGVTHIFVNLSEMRRFMGDTSPDDMFFGFETEEDHKILRQFFSPQYVRVLISQNHANLYEVLYPDRKP